MGITWLWRAGINSVLILALFGCSSNKTTHEPTKRFEIFVSGDPSAIVSDTQLDSDSFLTLDNYESFNNYSLNQMIVFNELSVQHKQDWDQVVDSARTEEEETIESPIFNFERNGDNIEYSGVEQPISFTFVLSGSNFNLSKIEVNDVQKETNVLHYSISEDKQTFSILYEISENGTLGKSIQAIYFRAPSEKIEPSYTEKVFNYLLGPSKKVRWSDESMVKANLCGPNAKSLSQTFFWAVDQWKEHMGDSVQVQSDFVELPPPFSDVNSHCTYVIDNYLRIQSKEFTNPGLNIPVIDGNSNSIVDSDIFLFKTEIEKSGDFLSSKLSMGKQRVVLHELGHFFGLGHEMDQKSVMSYDKTYILMSHDKESIKSLYE